LKAIDAIFYRDISAGDFFNIERGAGQGPAGGGGQTYIDIPHSIRNSLLSFLGVAPPVAGGQWPTETITAAVVGSPNINAPLEFAPRTQEANPRYKISRQARQVAGNQRHPAWTDAHGFPRAPNNVGSRQAAQNHLPAGTRIYLVRTTDDAYYAGHVRVTGAAPAGWPDDPALRPLFTATANGGGVLEFRGVTVEGVEHLVRRVLDAWRRKPNVLLYGPPATGKTHAMSIVWRMLDAGDGGARIAFDPDDAQVPFKLTIDDIPISLPARREWVTFHQNYSYEEFILGLRPVPAAGGGLTLRPRVGRLLDLAIGVSNNENGIQSGVMYIDEVNRGNVSRIFGEFLTFMDVDYRDRDLKNERNSQRLPVPIPMVGVANNQTEPLERPAGDNVRITVPWYFPGQVFVLASMNSVDRAVAPLDSALARRFERVEVGPDMELLAVWLQVNIAALQARVAAIAPGQPLQGPPLTAGESAWLLLHRLNYHLATTLGAEFEFGHAYFLKMRDVADDDERFREIARIWDEAIFPQLQERFLGRPDQLLRLLKLGPDDEPPANFALRLRVAPGPAAEEAERPALERVSLVELSHADLGRVRDLVRYLAVP
jgi:hypothetical protein